MKIAIDVSQIVYTGTGVARYTEQLTKHLLKIDKNNKYLFYAGTLRARNILKQYRNNIPWKSAEWKTTPISPKLADLLFNKLSLSIDTIIGDVDIFHASDWTHPKTNAISVTTVHDLVFEKYPETLDSLIVATQTRRMSNIVKHSTHIIADSLSTKNDLMKIYGIPSDNISVIYLACDHTFTPQSHNEIERVKSKYNIKTKYILSLGTKEPRKNINRIIKAFNLYKHSAKSKDISLVISGKHGWGEKIRQDQHDIIETGFIGNEDLPALYSGAELFIYPSLYEGFGLPVLEAMSCGVPVITSNTSSLPEVAGDAGILIDPTDTLAIRDAIIKALIRKQSLSRKSLKQSQKFSWIKTAEQTLSVYESLYNRSKTL